jgi:uncharacterized protein YjbI with pentapeptide repeats
VNTAERLTTHLFPETDSDTSEDEALSRKSLHKTQERGQLLDGAELSGAEINQKLNLAFVSLRNLTLTDASLSDADFTEADLSGAFLNNVNLPGGELYKSDLSDAVFTNADLPKATFSESDLSGTEILGSDLSGAYMQGVDLSGSTLNDTDLSEAELPRATLPEAELKDANLSDANITGADLSEADLRKSDLSEATLYGADLSEAVLYESNLLRAVLGGANLSKAVLGGANFSKATLGNADLSETKLTKFSGANQPETTGEVGSLGVDLSKDLNFSGAILHGADLSEATLYGGDFSEADLGGADLSGADLSGADFSEADLRKADLSESNNEEADFTEADLEQSIFTNAHLSEARLTGADCEAAGFAEANLNRATLENTDLTGATLSQAYLYQTRLTGAQINETTQFHESGDIGNISTINACRYDSTVKPDHPTEAIEAGAVENDEKTIEEARARRARSTYSRIEDLARENGFPELKSEMFIRRQNARRELLFAQGQWLKGAFAQVQNTLFQYGENFSRIVVISLGTILFWWVLYMFFPVVKTASGRTLGFQALTQDPPLILKTLLNSLLIFFAGSRVLETNGLIGEVLVVVESIVGPILVALLIFVLGRRAAR